LDGGSATYTQDNTNRIHTSMIPVGFEPTTPALELAKTVDTTDRAATVVG
jgi:hypothetical protein